MFKEMTVFRTSIRPEARLGKLMNFLKMMSDQIDCTTYLNKLFFYLGHTIFDILLLGGDGEEHFFFRIFFFFIIGLDFQVSWTDLLSFRNRTEISFLPEKLSIQVREFGVYLEK